MAEKKREEPKSEGREIDLEPETAFATVKVGPAPADQSSDHCLSFSVNLPEGLDPADAMPVMVVIGVREGHLLVTAPEGADVAGLARKILELDESSEQAGGNLNDEEPPPGALLH